GSAICTFPNTTRGRANIDCVSGYRIDRDIHYSPADIGRTDKPPPCDSEWSIRLLRRLSQHSSLISGLFRGSNWNSAVSSALSNAPFFRWTLFLCVSGIGFARSLSWFALFSIRANQV